MRSSAATRYQLGLVRHAGAETVPASASTPHGSWESAMNAARLAGRSPANDAAKRSRSSSGKPSTGGRIGGTGASGGGSAGRRVGDERAHRLAPVRANAAMYTTAATASWVPASVTTAPP